MVFIFWDNEKVKLEYEYLKTNKEFKSLHNAINRALDCIEKNPSCGIAIPRKLWPKKYKNRISLYKYDLPMAFRLLYEVKTDSIRVLAIILEWCSHKDYEKLFKYKVR